MSSPILISVNPSLPSNDLTIHQISYLGRVLIKPTNVPQAVEFIRSNFLLLDIYVDATTIVSTGDIADLLNEGAAKVFIAPPQAFALSEEHKIPSDRLIITVDTEEEADELKAWIEINPKERKAIGLCAQNPKDPKQVASTLGLDTESQHIYTQGSTTGAVVKENAVRGVVSIISSTSVSFDRVATSDKIQIAHIFTARAVADPASGLYATLVTDERGLALGLVWSSDESIAEALRTGTGVYQSRKRGLWYKGQSSGDVQELVRVGFDCDGDCLVFVVKQKGKGFCHLGTATCFGQYSGLARLQKTLLSRRETAPEGSYSARLFNDPKLLEAKIMEEAEELCQASSPSEIAAEAADLLYFALAKCTAAGVSLGDIERNLDLKNLKVTRRKGDAKGPWAEKLGLGSQNGTNDVATKAEEEKPVSSTNSPHGKIEMRRIVTASTPADAVKEALQRPGQKSNISIMDIVKPIIQDVRENGDAAVLNYTHKFEKATSLESPVLRAPFPESLMQLPSETKKAIDTSYENIRRFHSAQQDKPLQVETMPGVICSRFSRPIERVGLYIPGGTAVLPSTALMLGVPAMVAGCKEITFASPPRPDGSITPEIVYIAHKVGADSIVLAGGAQAVAALAYGTQSISKVDKILGPGNQFVTAAKMIVSNDASAGVSIDMPAGPSEVLVIADKYANPAFVASDLLSQAEHGVDSQVILIAVDLNESQLRAIDEQILVQANALPRVDIVRGSISHSVIFVVKDIHEAMALSNEYAPEHLILQVENAEELVSLVQNAGSVFIGAWTPESVGDYSAGVNHSLPTYGYAKQYSGVNLGSFLKHITSSNLTAEGLRGLSSAVMTLAAAEGLDAHKRAVSIRMKAMEESRLENSLQR